MNKAQLVQELSGRFEGDKKQAQHALDSVIDVIQRALVKGEKVGITGFGSFEKIDRAARIARNPATGATVKVKKTSVARFRPGAELKAVVSGAKKLPKLATGAAAGGRRAGGAAAPTGRTSATTAASTASARRTAATKTAAKSSSAGATKTAASSTPVRGNAATKATTKATGARASASRATAKGAAGGTGTTRRTAKKA